MWKKNEEDVPASPPTYQPAAPPRPESRREPAIIGPSITMKGDLSGAEDLTIQGRIEGSISLRQHNVTVGSDGRVKADIYGRSIRIDGEVEGNLFGEEEVVVRQSGRVRGNITAPRVTLENGANFKGSIDMEPKTAQRAGAAAATTARPTREPAEVLPKAVGAPLPAQGGEKSPARG